MDRPPWERVAAAQAGMISRRQLNEIGVDRWRARNQLAAKRWVERSSMVFGTTTGPLSREQATWLGVRHAGPGAIVTILVPDELEFEDANLEGLRFVRTRPRSGDGAVHGPELRDEPGVVAADLRALGVPRRAA